MTGIKKLDVFMTRQFLLLFVGTFFISQFVLMMQFLWQYIDKLIGKGLTIDVLAQFFWYMSLMLVPQAMPLAILLSSLITFGNLGESSELTAIKAAGISLLQSMRSLTVIVILIAMLSFFFQNVVGPSANMSFAQLLLSMKQKSPELEIPEGVFYDGIPGSNIYVQKKDGETGKLYGIMIYRMTDSFEDAAIILADSGMLQSTADKKHLLLNLWNGEWFENMKNSQMSENASVPYRRETFTKKRIVFDFDSDFNLADAGALANNARGKSLSRIKRDLDSLRQTYDSIGRSYYNTMPMAIANMQVLTKGKKVDRKRAEEMAGTKSFNIDSVFSKMPTDKKLAAVNSAMMQVQTEVSEVSFRAMVTSDGDRLIRQHQIEAINKFTMSLSCLIFFFIGAPLGAIIRKGGLGVPVIISVIVFIIYYIFDNTGYRMARGGMWAVWFGKGIAPAVLIPLAIFFTYKANNDSVVFNLDAYREFFMRLLGMRIKRNIVRKEVIINDPEYSRDSTELAAISDEIAAYANEHRLVRLPGVVKVFFRYQPDHAIENIGGRLDRVIEDLSNTRDRVILTELNNYPVMSLTAHTRPFERKWLNAAAAILFPLGIVLYVRMCRFRFRLYRDLRTIRRTNENIIKRIGEMSPQ
ncbi:MAG: LptF/LptG family permease [Prevotella sp.]|uniref:LptF/LptG family permease n=1 Tax=Prevotella sp. TaxID=59823 RepID=UPI002A3384C3|nr:LptF/LptG family permease [Prevotella sp.]MDD7318993.1 LptF/LptG family permease [Prevotellaceae bacterium]MDY4020773.1 LptF/LptG family permease [Prevotella sp.]